MLTGAENQGSVVLLHLGSVLMIVAHVTTKGHRDLCSLLQPESMPMGAILRWVVYTDV